MSDGYFDNAIAVVSLVTALLLLLGALRLRWRIVRVLCGLVGIVAVIIAGVFVWYGHRPLPALMDETPFQGVEYIREVRDTPRPLVIHVVRIDLDAPGLRFFVTPQGEDIPARTVSQYLDEYDLQLAINADYFQPWHDTFPWDYYPHSSDPVNTRGLSASEGAILTRGFAGDYDTLYITEDNHVSFDSPQGAIYNAVSGTPFLLLNGASLVPAGDTDYFQSLHPRTAVGVDESERVLILMLVDGRQPGYSEGVSLAELSDLLLEFGAHHAINLDGGGSTTLVIEDADGAPQVLNSPIYGHVPGRERPVANQLGVYAQR